MQISTDRLKRIGYWMILDALVMLAAYAIAFFARTIVTPREFISSLGFIAFCIGVMITVFYALGLYHRIWRYTSGHEVARIVFGVMIVTAVTLLVDYLLFPGARPLPLSVIVLGNMLTLSGFVGLRYKSRLISGLQWRWEAIWHQKFPDAGSVTRVLIVGAGEAGQNFAWRMKHRWPAAMKHEVDNFTVVGFVDDDPTKRGMYVEGVQVIGGRADIPRLVEKHRIDLIVLAMHNIPGPAFREVLAYCESTDARIRIVPNAYALMNNHHTPLLRELRPEDILGRKPIGRHEGVDFSPVTGKVVLVTGAAGSIGSELCRQILQYAPVALLMLDNNESGLHDMVVELADHSHNGTRLIPVLADITRRETIEPGFAHHRPQVIFHAAAYKHVPMLELHPQQAVQVNVGGTRLIGELARQYGAERFVLISTDKAVDPTSVMGASKRLCEYLMHAFARLDNPHGTLFTSVRFGNVLGSRGSVVPMFNKQIEAGGPVTVTDREMKRFFMTIPEAVNLVIHAACLTRGDDLFMLRMGEEVRILDLAERMIRMRGLRPYEDIPIHFSGTRPGEKLSEALSLEEEHPTATIHPDIVNLLPPLAHFHPQQFLANVDALGQDCQFMPQHAGAVAVESTPAGPAFRAAPHNCLACIIRCVDTAFFENDTTPVVLPGSSNGHSPRGGA